MQLFKSCLVVLAAALLILGYLVYVYVLPGAKSPLMGFEHSMQTTFDEFPVGESKTRLLEVSIIQIAQCALQRIEIAVYHSRISDFMVKPDMADPEKSNWIQWQFEMFVILVPFVSQFALLPVLVIDVNLGKEKVSGKEKVAGFQDFRARSKLAFLFGRQCNNAFSACQGVSYPRQGPSPPGLNS